MAKVAVKTNTDRQRSVVLSDLLKAEIQGAPLDWARYCADYPKRKRTLEQLSQDRYIQLLDSNRWGLTFDGLLLIRTTEAKQVTADCQRIYDVMRSHYKKVLHQQVTVGEVAKRMRQQRSLKCIAIAISMLTRGSGMGVNCGDRPVTAESKVNGNHDLLEKSFRKQIKVLRENIAQRETNKTANTDLMNRFPGNLNYQPDTSWLISALESIGSDEVKSTWKKCITRSEKDLAGSITAAKSLVESACKQTLTDRGIDYPVSSKLPALYALVRKELSLDPSGVANESLRAILGGCATVINGLSELRNIYGDSHGQAPGSAKPAQRHARLAVSLAGAMAEFLLATDEGRKRP